MLFNDIFISSLQDDPVNRTIELCEMTFQALEPYNDNQSEWQTGEYEILLEAYSLMVEIIESKLLPIQLSYPLVSGDMVETCVTINRYLRDVHKLLSSESAKLKVQSLRSKFRVSLGNGFAYEFTQGDLDRVQILINELRDKITKAKQLEQEHQQRLLRRLEKLQAELHKKVSDLDRFWGLIGDAGVVLGKLGNDAKPIVDRVREIADIVWQTQSRAEELPSGTHLPFLEHKPHTEDDQV